MPTKNFQREFERVSSELLTSLGMIDNPCVHFTSILGEIAIRELKIFPDILEFRRTGLDVKLNCLGLKAMSAWGYHRTLVIGEDVYDPFLGEVVKGDEYAETIFPNNDPKDYTLTRSRYTRPAVTNKSRIGHQLK